MSRLNFTLEKEASGSKARAARFQTLHGEVQTPIFMPVGTQATVRFQTVETLKATGSRVLLANTYHLMLRPGPEVFRHFGGIHAFMKWDGPVLTDSGGYQIFSLPHSRAMNEEGAHFRSYVDGKMHMLSPETSIEMQRAIGSDIMMVLDHCIPSTAPHEQARIAMELTHRWALRSLAARGDSKQALFGIVQGACHQDLREASAAFLREQPFDGLAIGGLAVGETHEERYRFTGIATEQLPKQLPRYLMGVGTPIDILESVHRGVDMFDCIIQSQFAQRGTAFSSHGKIHFRRSAYKFSKEPVDAQCNCHTCRNYTRGYIHHLIKADEALGWQLLGEHNLAFYHRLMREMREAILRDDFLAYYERKKPELMLSDEDNPVTHPKKAKIPQVPRLGDYELQRSSQGFSSIRQISSGEVMHSVSNPADEARKLYVEQSHLASRILKTDTMADELVIWDVGLGAASNAMAVVRCFELCFAERGPEALRPLRIVSFECDLDPLKLACKNAPCFPHLHHGAPYELLERGTWAHFSGLLHWDLVKGDFLDHLEQAQAPDLIYYDPFSFKTDSALWTSKVFARVHTQCGSKNAELYTYSASTAVRVALLSAGFCVAEGVGTGPKADTTLAFARAEGMAAHPSKPKPLGEEWLKRWRKSHSKWPAHFSSEEKARLEQQIESHPQFRSIQ